MSFRYRFPLASVMLLTIMSVVIVCLSCKSKNAVKSEFYTEGDFKLIPKIDIHCHIGVERHAFMEQALEYNFRILTINTDAVYDLKQSIEEQERIALLQRAAFPGHLAYLTTFSMAGWDNDGCQ
jgi:hypothetical protein